MVDYIHDESICYHRRRRIYRKQNPRISSWYFIIGSGVETTIQSHAKTIIELSGSSSKIVPLSARPGNIVYSGADVSKAKEKLGFKAETSLIIGLKQTIFWYEEMLK